MSQNIFWSYRFQTKAMHLRRISGVHCSRPQITIPLKLFIHDTNTLIEIKSTLSFSQESTFPTVYSERAVKQLTEISRLLDEGYRACYILVSLNPSVKEITINSEIEDYYKEFMKCIEKGMTYCAFSIRLHEQTPELYAKIKITI